jgi:putative intracellular protease/amidase
VEQQNVHLFVFDTLSDWEPAYAVAGINNPSFQTQPGRYRVTTVALEARPVTTIGGVMVLPHMTLDRLAPADSAMLILPGGKFWDDGKNIEAATKAKSFIAAGVPVAAICGATAGLARVGVLDFMHHTSNSADYLKATGYQGAALYRDQPAVTEGKLITAGATAPLEFAREIFKCLGLYTEDTLEAWYGLFKTGNPAYYAALAQASH